MVVPPIPVHDLPTQRLHITVGRKEREKQDPFLLLHGPRPRVLQPVVRQQAYL
jgi:hypothetical protein